MSRLHTFLILIFLTFSLHAADEDYAFSTCADVNLSDMIKVIEINTTNFCHIIDGSLDESLFPVDVFVYKIVEDMNVSFWVKNLDTVKDMELLLDTDVSGCGNGAILNDDNIDHEEERTTTMEFSGGTYPQYIYVRLENTNNNNVLDYSLALGIDGTCGGDGVPGDVVSNTSADIIDTSITNATLSLAYNNSLDTTSAGIKYLKTKVAGETTSITAVYLDDSNESVDYDNSGQDVDDALFFMIPLLNDTDVTGGCPAATTDTHLLQQLIDPATGQQAVMKVRDLGGADYSDTLDVIMPTIATQHAKIEFIVVDSSLLSADAQNCVAVSSTSGNLEGLGQCVNSEVQYVDAYGQTAYDRCAVNTLYGSPCLPSSGGVGTGVFASALGCLMCTFYAGTSCSTDDFAIRPEKLDVNSTNPDMPNLLRSAEDYNTTVYAYNYATTNLTTNYTVPDANTVLQLNITKYDRNNAIDVAMAGTATFAPVAFNILNGVSVKSGVIGNEVAGLTFDDVGKINIRIEDRNWSAVDNDDTPMSCDSNGTYVCGDVNVTFIPDHFDLNTSISNNDSDNDGNPAIFTYLATQIDQMAVRIGTTIRALNKDNNVTQNFGIFPMYENPVTVVPVVTKPTYLYPDANESNITNLLIGFNSGLKTINPTELNTSIYLRFNFQRDVNVSINPFDVNGSDLNISITSNYVDGANTADITGDQNMTADGSARMIYGRTNGPLQSFTAPIGTAASPAPALIYYESYCNATDTAGVTCNKALLPNGIDSNSTNDPRWFVNKNHTAPTEGELGSVNQKTTGATHVTPDTLDNTVLGQTTVPLTYDTNQGYPYKTTMENNASSWLIYNKYDATAQKNEFEVEFIGPQTNNWAGQHETNTTTDTNASQRTNRRSMW